MRRLAAGALLVALLLGSSGADAAGPGWIRRDEAGVLRSEDGSEIRLWGVNYLAPFSVDYANLKRSGVDPRAAIDRDLDDLLRLEMNLVRVRVTEREITDREGNLIENEHLALLDHLIAGCRARGIAVLLTPISWFESAAETTTSFADVEFCNDLVNRRELWPAQERYLGSLAGRVNRVTGVALRDDPTVALWEIIHDPSPRGITDDLLAFDVIGAYGARMKAALRDAGVRQPILFSGLVFPLVDERPRRALETMGVDGYTYCFSVGEGTGGVRNVNFLWRREFNAWILRNPLAPSWGEGFAPVFVEFDFEAATRTYMYPAAARSMVAAGVQVAALFHYDPRAVAAWNAGYRSSYANLAFTPQKAVSLVIAGRVFRSLPLGDPLPDYPPDNWDVGAGALVSAARDLALLRDEATGSLLYTNRPGDLVSGRIEDWRTIVGADSSALVGTAGPGYYRLDVDAEAGRIDLDWEARVRQQENPFELARWNNNIRFVKRVADLVEGPTRVTLNLADRAVAIHRRRDDGTLEPVGRGEPAFDAVPGRYVIFLDETR